MCVFSLLSVAFGGWFSSKSPPLDSGVGGGIETVGGEVWAVEAAVGRGVSGAAVVVLGGITVVDKSNSPNLFSASGAFVGS